MAFDEVAFVAKKFVAVREAKNDERAERKLVKRPPVVDVPETVDEPAVQEPAFTAPVKVAFVKAPLPPWNADAVTVPLIVVEAAVMPLVTLSDVAVAFATERFCSVELNIGPWRCGPWSSAR